MYLRETLAQAELTLVDQDNETIVVQDTDGKRELYVCRPDGVAGYALLHRGMTWEFCRSL